MGTRRRFGNVRKLPSGRWQARFAGVDGAERAGPHTFATKTDVFRYLATAEADLLRGDWHDHQAGQITVRAWGERYLAAQQSRLTPKTYTSYDSLWRTCIEPTFAATMVARVQKIAVREWVAQMTGRGLGPSRVTQALRLLSQILAAAVDDRLMLVNPCQGVRPPRMPETEPRILNPDEVARLSSVIRPPFGVLVDLLAYCGPRIGEAFALRRRCVDPMRARLLIEESLAEIAGRHSFGDTKTHQKRAVALPLFLLEDLQRHLAENVPADPDALLFVGRTGKPLHYNSFRHAIWDPAVEAAGLIDVTPHDLRATCGTWVADAAGVIEAARRLGHSRASVTTRHYARPVEGRDREVADRLSQLHCTNLNSRSKKSTPRAALPGGA
ncbi:MAG TPA: site-specific integrase [Mycobacteriales bacterium]|nr:site-specific integrase [Mycobacteriales bacterium]